MIQDKSKSGLIKTFFSYAIPCIIGMFLTSLITIVDGIFIGNKLGGNGLAAVNLTLPILYLLLGIAIMIGLGGVTLATQNLGEKSVVRARERFSMTVVLNTIVILLMVLILKLFLENIVHILNAKGILQVYVKNYLGTMSFFYLFMMLNIIFSMFIRGEGRPQLSVAFGLIGNIINVFLDYLFIIKFDFGLTGAAFASGISVTVSFIIGSIYFLSGKSIFKPVKFRINSKDIKRILFNGSSEFIGQISICITTYLFNLIILKRIGIDGVAAFTIIGYVSFIEVMIITGIAQGINTLVSYCFGAKDNETIMRLLSIGIRSVLIIGIGAFIVSIIATEGIIRAFVGNRNDILEIARGGMRLFALSFLMNGYNFIASAYFTSLGNAKTSAIIAILRSLLFNSILIFVLPLILGDLGIWLTVPLAEALTIVFSYVSIYKSRLGLSTAFINT